MEKQATFPGVFERLRALLEPYAAGCTVTAASPEAYMLDAPFAARYGKPLFFGGVQIKKNYVSYHLMPVYIFPDLLDAVPAGLRKRMQGKSCFNFTRLDDALLGELAQLTQAAAERFQREGLLAAG